MSIKIIFVDQCRHVALLRDIIYFPAYTANNFRLFFQYRLLVQAKSSKCILKIYLANNDFDA